VNGLKPQPEPSTQEVLAGIVERVTYHNAENGFCVLRIKARGHRELVTDVGHAATVSAVEWVTASREWVNDRTHGQQFKSRFIRTSARTGKARRIDQAQIDNVVPPLRRPKIEASFVIDDPQPRPWRYPDQF
jgi:hypothetical protein